MFTYDNSRGNLHVIIISIIFFFLNVWTGCIISRWPKLAYGNYKQFLLFKRMKYTKKEDRVIRFKVSQLLHIVPHSQASVPKPKQSDTKKSSRSLL